MQLPVHKLYTVGWRFSHLSVATNRDREFKKLAQKTASGGFLNSRNNRKNPEEGRIIGTAGAGLLHQGFLLCLQLVFTLLREFIIHHVDTGPDKLRSVASVFPLREIQTALHP